MEHYFLNGELNKNYSSIAPWVFVICLADYSIHFLYSLFRDFFFKADDATITQQKTLIAPLKANKRSDEHRQLCYARLRG